MENNESRITKILTFVVMISLGANVILFLNRGNTFPTKKELIVENAEHYKNVIKYSNELNKYKGISAKINKAVEKAKAQILLKEKQIEKLRNESKLKDKVNKSLMSELELLNETHLNIIDSLLIEQENTKLINTKISDLEESIAELNKKIGLGSLLITDNISIKALKQTANSKKTTAIAKRAKEFEICFDILENKLSKSGNRNIYIVITSPDAKVISNTNAEPLIFKHADYNTTAECSKIENIEYKNQKTHICTTVTPKTVLKSGLYLLEIFSDENKLGTTTVSLK